MPRLDPPKHATDRPVLPWRIVAGAFLHFALPAYLLVGLACSAAGLLGGLKPPELASRALPVSALFGVLYLGLAVTATMAALLLDSLLRHRRRGRDGRDPEIAERHSRRNLAGALAEGRSGLDRDALATLEIIASAAWDHEDPICQSASADLAEMVRTSLAAAASVKPERRADVTAVTAVSLARIAAGLRNLQEQRARLDEGDLHTIARYIDSRYPPSDCAGDSVG